MKIINDHIFNHTGLIVLVFLGLVLNNTTVQAQDNDLELWSSIEVNKSLSKKLALSLEQDLRLNNNVGSLKNYFTQFSAKYKLHKNLRVTAGYRYLREKGSDYNMYHAHLYFADLYLKHKYQRFAFSYRLRYQNKYTGYYSRENGSIPKSYLRNKLTVKYKIRKTRFSPYASAEVYHDLDYKDRYLLKKKRLTLGLKYLFKNKNEGSIYFILQKQENQDNPIQSGIIGMNYSFNL